MPSPFPGMDPFLEPSWRDVHASMVVYSSDRLQPILPAGLKARMDVRVFVEWPDPSCSTGPNSAPARGFVRQIELTEEVEEAHVLILDSRAGNRVVTCIEVLGPTNKQPGPGLASYRSSRTELLRSGASFVEVDLLRGGDYVLFQDLEAVESGQRGTYRICITRAADGDLRSECLPISLWHRLPVIPIPLRDTDDDVPLDLQSVLDQAYERGAYDDLDNTSPLTPPLSADDTQRLSRLLSEAPTAA